VTIKEQLLETLTRSENRLQEAINWSHAHQLTFHRSVYETWLRQVFESRRSVESLADITKADQIKEKVEIITKQEQIIIDQIADPSPTETAKTSAIYLAAQKALSSYEADHKTAQKYVDDVLAIVQQEALIKAQPNGSRVQSNLIIAFDRMFLALQESMSGWQIPGFKEYYILANKTRTLIESYVDHDMKVETVKMTEHLTKYDQLTLDMARAWPIVEGNLEYYYNV